MVATGIGVNAVRGDVSAPYTGCVHAHRRRTNLSLLCVSSTFLQGDYDNRTALHLAASMGKLECVNALMAAKASLDIEDRWGNTPLHVRSAVCGHLHVRWSRLIKTPLSTSNRLRVLQLRASSPLVVRESVA
jgi:hypothetical protein